MIDKDTDIECQWCNDSNKAEEWDSMTLGECKSREMRRAYKHVTDEKVWGNESNSFYKCPSCGTWSRGNQLKIVNTENEKLLKLGGQPVLMVKK